MSHDIIFCRRDPPKASGKSRLIREDENDKSDEEEEGVAGHMTFGKKDEPGRQMEVSIGREEQV